MTTLDYPTLLNLLKNNQKLSFSRWGDGEFGLAFKLEPVYSIVMDRNNSPEFIAAGEMIKEILLSKPEYYIGIQNHAKKLFGDKIESYYKDLNTFDADIIHKASQKQRLQSLIDILKDREVVLIGPGYLNLPIKPIKHIVIPIKNVWNYTEEISDRIQDELSDNRVFLYSASIVSNILIDRFYIVGTHLDMGSVFDPYCGVNSRKYHSQITWKLN